MIHSTFNFRISPFFAVANINIVERSFRLREAKRKLFQGARAIHTTISLHCFAQTRKIRYDLGHNLQVLRRFAESFRHGSP